MTARSSKGPSGSGSAGEALTFQRIMARKKWDPLPAFIVLGGNAEFMKDLFIRRFSETLFGDEDPVVQRFDGPPNDAQLNTLPLAQVLDELRTLSFFSNQRLVVVREADVFLGAHAESLLPFASSGFAGGHLIALVKSADRRRKLIKTIEREGWVVQCQQPYDRPPPWDTRTPAWDSELSRWVVTRATRKELQIDLQTAFALHSQAGSDLAVIEEELEKIRTVLGSSGSREVTVETIQKVVGDTHDRSVFDLVELFLEGRRSELLKQFHSLLHRGFVSRGTRTTDPTAIVLIFVGGVLPRLRAIRRAHAMRATGGSQEDWLRAGLVKRPFLPRFERQFHAVSAAKATRLLSELYDLDRAVKTGGDAARLLELILTEHGVRA